MYPHAPVPGWRTKLPFYYGWVIVGSAFLALSISFGVYYSASIFNVALLDALGWGRATTASIFSLFVLVYGLGGPAAGWLVDRFGPARVVPVGAALLSLGLLASSQATELWQFYLYFGLIGGFGVCLSSWVPAMTVLGQWFVSGRGLAIGVASGGIGLGTVVMAPLSQYLMLSFGWRSTFVILAGVVLFGSVPQVALLQVGRPELLGLAADGGNRGRDPAPEAGAARLEQVVDKLWASRTWSLASAARTQRFYLLFGMNLFVAVATQTLWVHSVAYLVDEGYDKMLAASVVGVAAFASIPAKLIWGALSDWVGREVTYSMGVAALVTAFALLVLTTTVPGLWLVVLFGVSFGIGYAAQAPLSPAAAADIFAGGRFGSIFGAIASGTGIGSSVGAWWAGFIFDVTGSYLTAFALAAACVLASVCCLWLAAPRKVRRVLRDRSRAGVTLS